MFNFQTFNQRPQASQLNFDKFLQKSIYRLKVIFYQN